MSRLREAVWLLAAALPLFPQTPPAEEKPAPIPSETTSVTDHELQLEGKTLHYKATAGTLLINGDDEKPYGIVFYVAYTLGGVSDPRTRPVTFLYNGGPGSASLWLHMGSIGPVRVATASPEATGAAPYQVSANQYSLLDKSDLVFIDAVGTGYSRPVGKAAIKNFAGTDQDVQAFSKFIQRYVEVNHRWNSPKFLFGESYGTTRSAALVDALENAGMSFNGVILMSTILNYFTQAPGSDAVFIGNLPSYAAIAWHHEKIAHKGDEKAFLAEVRAFARGPYAEALAQGQNLPQTDVDAMAAKLAGYTGLSVPYLKEANLRVSPSRFRKELLRDQRMILGRYDARFEGTDADAAGETPGYDPSSTGITGAFVSAFHDYLDRELKYSTKETYFPRGPKINEEWDHAHHPPGAGGPGPQGPPLRDAYVAGDLADAMRKNPRLKVFSANGLFDLATPFFITEYDLAHMQLEPKLRGNIEFAYYHSGHMIYLNVDALKQLKSDLAGFIRAPRGISVIRLAAVLLIVQPLAAGGGADLFARHCAACHGSDARGTGKAPGLAANPRLAGQSTSALTALIQRGFPDSGMPAFDLPVAELNAVAAYVERLNAGMKLAAPPAGRRVTWGDPQPGDWLTYNGNVSANRYSALKEINTGNVSRLRLQWIFPIPHFGLEVTPLEAAGVMYVTGPNQVYAIDALTGEQIWKYSRPQTRGLVGDASLGTNRGVAIRDALVFFVTDNAHLIALDRATGSLVWETALGPEQQHYGGTLAPLVVADTVIAGVSGADEGIRGFVACYKAATGELVWRHWTVPRRGEPGSETWKGSEPLMGGGSTWLTGSYDPETGTLYWPTGNPFPDSEDADRGGDNLYTDSILALNPANGTLKWHYQFTPHDLRDRDATEPPVLVNTEYRGRQRKLLLHADRNGFFYVFDRITGELLLAKPFLRRVDWASGIAADGRPVVQDPGGCPDDAANWSSTAYSPATRLYYFMALEECVGTEMGYPDQTGQRYLRALNIETGVIAWEVPQPGAAKAKSWTGVLATAGGLVFYGKPNGGFDAVDQPSGKTLWHFPTNVRMKASPMTFSVHGKQFVAVAAGPNILCFGL